VSGNPKTSGRKLAKDLATANFKYISLQTIRNRLHESGYKGRAARKKPFINERNRRKRLEFARAYVNKPIDFWKTVLFSGESKFNIFGYDVPQYVLIRPKRDLDPKNIIPTVKQRGGHAMVWGCMDYAVGELAIVEGIMNAKGYVNILRDNLNKSVRKLGIQDSYLFQQDNDPKHTARVTREYLLYNARGLLESPPQSPDINPIGNLWSLLETKIRKCKCLSRQMLIENLKKEWDKTGQEVTANLVNSMPRRLQAIIDGKGLHTKY
jgi:transposase